MEEKRKLQHRLLRLKCYGVVGLLLSMGIIIYNTITNASIWEYFSSFALIIASIIFLVASERLQKKGRNQK